MSEAEIAEIEGKRNPVAIRMQGRGSVPARGPPRRAAPTKRVVAIEG